MKLAISCVALAATAALALPGPSLGATPEFRIPDFSHLNSRATEVVDVSVGGFLLGLARMVIPKEDRANDPALSVLDDIKSVTVRSFKFDSDDAWSRQDIDSVRSQLTGPQWNSLVQVRKRNAREDVDVYICMEENKSCGLAVIATQPREFTVVSIVGSIDIDKLAALEGEFGIPKIHAETNVEQ
jgi:Domain of unknown function (DUF4252)